MMGDKNGGGQRPLPVKTVRMKIREEWANGGPLFSDVHPDEVENWKRHGWEVVNDGSDRRTKD